MLVNPMMYGLVSGVAVRTWVERELLPEVNILADLAHKNVIRLRCVGLDTVSNAVVPAYVAMDLCSGGTLQQWIRHGSITDRLMVEFLCDLIDAMVYLHHDKKVVHGDIKPDNIFVHDDERQQRPFLVLGDIGLAKQLNRSASLVSAAGAVAYRAPEACIDAAKCSQASDIYSVSLVAVELVTGRCVYSECNGDVAMATALVAEATARLSSTLEFCGDSWLSSEAAEMLLGVCTVQDPTARTSFRAIVATCPRHERTSAILREQQLREMQAALEAAAKQQADREQQLRKMQAAREAAAKQQAHHEQQLREMQAAREAAAKQQADREQQLQAALEAATKQQTDHEQQLREVQAALEAATKQHTDREPAAAQQQRPPSAIEKALRKAEQNDERGGEKRQSSAGVVALRRPTTAALKKRTSLCTPTDRAKSASRQ